MICTELRKYWLTRAVRNIRKNRIILVNIDGFL